MRSETNIFPAISNNLKEIINICISRNIPFVSFSLPQQMEIVTMIQYKSFPRKVNIENQLHKNKGFLITPFSESSDDYTFLIEPDITFTSSDINEIDINLLKRVDTFLDSTNLVEKKSHIATQAEFENNVTKIKKAIKEGLTEKVVLSRVYYENCSSDINISDLFFDIKDSYPDAFRYIFKLPETDCWIGASPEPLLVVKENIAETVSLAATKKMNGIPLDKIVWSSKEMIEQKHVTQYIQRLLSGFGILNYIEKGPTAQKAGQMIHLKSVFTFNPKSLENSPGKFINSLHPTPSVCGFPKEESMQLIKVLEKHQREYYTGFLGPINMKNETHLYVNIRCMKKQGNKFALYQGAGITEGSDPASEWNETQHKMMTMLSVLRRHCSCL